MLGMASPVPGGSLTPLKLYLTGTHTGVTGKLTPSNATAAGSHNAVHVTTGGSAWYELGLGTEATKHASEPAPTGHGAAWLVATLAGHHIVAGKWTFVLDTSNGATATNGTIHVRAFRKNGATYVQIGSDLTKAGKPTGTITVTGTLPQATFATGTELYFDAFYVGTAVTTGATTPMVLTGLARTAVTTPGYV